MADLRKNGNTSNLMRFVLLHATTGAPLTGLSSASSGLIISTVADNESAATAYTVAGSTIETISTLGTFATPTATKCRFKEVDSTNHPGLYEFQFDNARFAVSNGRRLIITVSGATNLLATHYEIQLIAADVYDAVRLGLTALPNAAAEAAGGLFTRGTGAGQIDQENGGTISVNVKHILRTTLTEGALGRIAGAFQGFFNVASPVLTTASVNQTGDSYARIGSAGAGLTALGDTRIANLDAAITTRLAPTTAGRTLDVTATGEAGVDWGNVGSPTTTVNLSGTTVKTATDVEADTQDIQSRLPAALTGGGNIKADAQVVSDKTGFALSSAGIQAIWDALTSALTTVGSIGKLLADNINATISSRSTLTASGVWDALVAGITTANSIGKQIVDNLNATITSRLASGSYVAPPSAADNRAEMDGNSTKLANLDAAVSSRLATSGYTVPPTAVQNRQEMDTNSAKLANLDVATSTRLASGSYTAPDNAGIARLLGLNGENAVLTSISNDADGRLTAATKKLYDSAAHAEAGGATGLLYTFAVAATYDGDGQLTSYVETRVS